MKWRNSKERELLASGGSRDQTLPNKNNPNPDLSDARTDRPPSLSPTSPQPSSPNAMEQQQTPAAEPFANSGTSTPTKLNESRKMANGRSVAVDCNGKSDKLFKLEYDESRPPPAQQQQLFNNFYDKVRDINTTLAFANRPSPMNAGGGGALNVSAGSGGSNLSNFYYDEYDSNSDSDEEISVTWKRKIQRTSDKWIFNSQPKTLWNCGG